MRTRKCKSYPRLRLVKYWFKLYSLEKGKKRDKQFCIKNSYPAKYNTKQGDVIVSINFTHNMSIQMASYHHIDCLCNLGPERSRDFRYTIRSNTGLTQYMVKSMVVYYSNQLAYLVINHLLRFVVLPQHGEELNDIGVLDIS